VRESIQWDRIRGEAGNENEVMNKIRKVVVATDLSEPADEAIRQAHQRAAWAGAELAVCHVLPNEFHSNPLFPQYHQLEAMRVPAERDRMLETVSARVRQLTGRPSDGFQVFLAEGAPHAVIVEAAETWGADLIVVGSYGRTGLARVLIGSVAQKVVRHAHCAALVARPSENTGRVVVGTDFSDPALPAVTAAHDESRRTGVEVTIVHSIDAPLLLPEPLEGSVAAGPPLYLAGGLEAIKEAALQRLAAAQEKVGLHGDRRVAYGPAATSLLRIAEELHAELLVVGTAGRTGLHRALLGSVAEAVVRAAPCSVLVVRLHQE
jgi:nucleotide-binding universal stress UspA family protein